MERKLQLDALKIIALLALFTLLNMALPIFSLVIYIIWPIPIVYLIVKYDIRESLIVIVLSAVINALFIGMTIDAASGITMGMYSIAGFGLIGFFLGSAIKEKFTPFKTLILTIIAVLISNLIILFVSPYVLGFNYQQLLNELSSYINNNSMFTEYSFSIQQYIYLIKLLFPAIIVVSAIIMGSLTYYITGWYLKRKNINIPEYRSIKKWSFPRWWLTIAIIITLLLRTYLRFGVPAISSPTINVILVNVLVLLFFLLFLQGFAVLIFYLSKLKSNILNIIFILALIFFNFLVFFIVALIGLIDLWFNLRKDKTR